MKQTILHILNGLAATYAIYLTFCNESLMQHPWMLATLALLIAADIATIILQRKEKSAYMTLSLLLFLTIFANILITLFQGRNTSLERWQVQSEYARRLSTAGDSSKIKFVGHGKKQIIGNEEEKNNLIEKMFGPDAVIAEKNNIFNIGEMSRDTTFFEKIMLIKKRVEPLIHIGTATVEMEWEYNGKLYFTTSILSGTGTIIYDNIGTMATGSTFIYSSDDF